MYMVISMPNRISIAWGVSHFMRVLLLCVAQGVAYLISVVADMLPRLMCPRNPRRHERHLMIFMSQNMRGPTRMTLCNRPSIVLAGFTLVFLGLCSPKRSRTRSLVCSSSASGRKGSTTSIPRLLPF
jgi:hypothetical protein